MKTIEQAATNAYSIEVLSSGCNAGVTFGKEMFKQGVEFAQQWISVENELPDKYQNVLLKEDSGSIYVGFYGGNSKLPICRATESRLLSITHWRPISFL